MQILVEQFLQFLGGCKTDELEEGAACREQCVEIEAISLARQDGFYGLRFLPGFTGCESKLDYPTHAHSAHPPCFDLVGTGLLLCTLLSLPEYRCTPPMRSPVGPTSAPAGVHSRQSEFLDSSVNARKNIVKCIHGSLTGVLHTSSTPSPSLTVWSGTTPDNVSQNSRLPLFTRCCRVSPSLPRPSSLLAAACVSTCNHMCDRDKRSSEIQDSTLWVGGEIYS